MSSSGARSRRAGRAQCKPILQFLFRMALWSCSNIANGIPAWNHSANTSRLSQRDSHLLQALGKGKSRRGCWTDVTNQAMSPLTR
jgi:hypothetical protein